MTKGALRPEGRTLVFVWLAVIASGGLSHCRRKHPRSFRRALSELRSAVRARDCKRLYRVVDEKTRWAAISLVRDAGSARALIEAHYPADRKARELARLRQAASAETAGQWVAWFCEHRGVLKEIQDLGRPPREVKEHKNRAEVVSDTGRKVVFERDPYGRWGCDVIRSRVVAAQLRMANLLKATKENVAYYEKQKIPAR